MHFGDERLPLRFWDKVSPEPMSGCWLWTAGLNEDGYGLFLHTRRCVAAHRVSYHTLVGRPGPGLELDHRCRIRSCVNPHHLEAVTHAENVRRGKGGLVGAARQRAKTHCPRGHVYAGDNLRVLQDGRRACRACARLRMRRVYNERKASK